MNYATFSNQPFTTSKKVLMKKKMSPEVKRRFDFVSSHVFSITDDPVTGEPKLEVCERERQPESGSI